MAHIVHQRLAHAFSTLNKDLAVIAESLNLTTTEFEGLLDQDALVPFSVLTNICNVSGVCRDYVLLNRGPMTPVIKTPLPITPERSNSQQNKAGIDMFIERLTAMLDAIPMNDTEMGEAIGLSKQSVGRWRSNGMITKANLVAVCEIEGFDYEWVKTGKIDTEEARDTYQRLYGSKLSEIDEQIARLQKQKESMAADLP